MKNLLTGLLVLGSFSAFASLEGSYSLQGGASKCPTEILLKIDMFKNDAFWMDRIYNAGAGVNDTRFLENSTSKAGKMIFETIVGDKKITHTQTEKRLLRTKLIQSMELSEVDNRLAGFDLIYKATSIYVSDDNQIRSIECRYSKD